MYIYWLQESSKDIGVKGYNEAVNVKRLVLVKIIRQGHVRPPATHKFIKPTKHYSLNFPAARQHLFHIPADSFRYFQL